MTHPDKLTAMKLFESHTCEVGLVVNRQECKQRACTVVPTQQYVKTDYEEDHMWCCYECLLKNYIRMEGG